ncbi:hypothetical protein SteCoe_6380 [Stentor coeruleus]|uniref:Acyl carrier protein n=1 Tax=Stentor coeruleus TaxID=5963 RepID=A0A1R2CQ33_9CILI|nr:hypothetical protein SteCoe_6380 [Stentor coeruleus]
MWKIALLRRTSSFYNTALMILKKFDRFDAQKYAPEKETTQFGLDSLDTVEFVIAMEDCLKIELTDEEALSINSINQALEMFKKYKTID